MLQLLRAPAVRLLAPTRQLSTSRPLLVKIRSAKDPNHPAASQPSPAEKPAAVPDDIGPSSTFEPVVNHPSGAPRPADDLVEAGDATAAAEAAPHVPPVPPAPESVGSAADDKADLSSLPSLDIDPEARERIEEPKEEGHPRGRTGAGRKEYVSSIERQRRMYARFGLASLLLGGVGAAYYLGSNGEGEGDAWTRFKSNFGELSDVFSKPAFKQLLPDPLPPPHQRPYTLLVDLEDLLVHSSWDRQYGWRTAKRPGVDYFLAYLSQFYEIVLFTVQPLYTAAPVAEKLDPFTAYLPYKLFREATRYVDGKVVKDLSYLNRDLSKVVMLDTNAEHAALQPENAIIIPPWDGTPGDKGLVEMIPFLESIGIFSPPDVRPILKAYEGKNIPVEYAKKEAEAKRLAVEEWERAHPHAVSGAGSGFLSGLFGSVANQRPNQPMTYLEAKRAQAQRIYQEEQKYWRDNAEEFKKLIEEDKQKQLAEMKGSLLGFLSGGASAAPPAEAEKK